MSHSFSFNCFTLSFIGYKSPLDGSLNQRSDPVPEMSISPILAASELFCYAGMFGKQCFVWTYARI